MKMQRTIKWLAGLGALLIILPFVAALLLAHVLDSPAVKDKIRVFLSTRTNANVAIRNIDLEWFPRPAVVVQGVSLAVGDNLTGTIPSIEVYPSIRGLLTGHLKISRMGVASPAITVHLPEWSKEPFDIDDIEGKIRSILAALAAEVPGIVVTVKSGSAEIKSNDRPSVIITDFDGRLLASPGAMDLQISSRANVFDSLRAEAKITGDTLATKGRIRIERLHLRESIALLLPRPPEYIDSGDINLDMGLTAIGLKKIKAEIDGTLPSLRLVRGSARTVIEGSRFKAAITRDAGIVNAVIERLDLASPRLTAAGELTVDPVLPSVRLKLVGRDLDVLEVSESALKIAGDIGVVEEIFRHVKGGKIPELSVQTAGRSFAELPKNIEVTGTMRGGKIIAYVLGIDLEDVSGSVVVSGGILEAKEFSARFGKIQGREGTLRLGLEGKSAPFHLDMMVRTDAAELRSLLLRVVKAEGFRKELSRLRNLEGELSGRLILGERTDSLFPTVSVLKATLSGSYDPIPYPISIKAGRFEYGAGKIGLADVSGAVGLSSFSGLTGSLNYNDSRQIEISSGKFSLDVAQAKNLLNRLEGIPKEIRDLDFVQGRLDLISLAVKGPLDYPSRWDFSSTGSVRGIAVKQAKLPGVMNLSGGTFNATPAKLMVSNANVTLLDAAVTVEGFVTNLNQAPLSLEATATGIIGAQMAEWLSRQIELPEPLMLRSPLQVANGRVLWKKDDAFAFKGELIPVRGPQLSLDIVRSPQTVEVKEILITDGEQQARMTLNLQKDQLAFSFNGTLEEKTLARIFQVPPLQGSLIQGDIEIRAVVAEPFRFTARGRLAGRELWVPLKNERAIVDYFFLEAGQGGVKVRSAELRWRNSRLSLMGNLLADTKAVFVDMDISADRVVWDELRELMDHGNNERILGSSFPPLEGNVRLKADNFTFHDFTWSPFQAAASFSPHEIRAEIERGNLCGIDTVGRVDRTDEEIGLDVSFSKTNGQLESTSRCLTKNEEVLTGSYFLNAHVAGRGTALNIAQSLRGECEFNARDGQFTQSPTKDPFLEATFDYLNRTGDFNVDFPDLDTQSFPFRAIRSQGTVEGMTLIIDELIIQSAPYIITGAGRIDVEHRQIDARGLVSVLLPAARLVRRIPIVGAILGGSVLGIPVRVTGPLEHPDVTYLSPADLGEQFLTLPLRILGLPLEDMRYFTPPVR
jgi:hypothetical protein